MDGQTTSYLKDYCVLNNIKITDITTLGEYLKANLPLGRYIIHSDLLKRGEGHWLGCICWLDKENEFKKSIFWFDSYGYRPHELFVKKCKEEDIKTVYNNIDFQTLNGKDSKLCGIYVCGFFAMLGNSNDNITFKSINKALEKMKEFEIKFPKT